MASTQGDAVVGATAHHRIIASRSGDPFDILERPGDPAAVEGARRKLDQQRIVKELLELYPVDIGTTIIVVVGLARDIEKRVIARAAVDIIQTAAAADAIGP